VSLKSGFESGFRRTARETARKTKKSVKAVKSVISRVPKLKERIKAVFTRPNVLAISLFAMVSKSLSFTWIFWDGLLSHKLYKHQSIWPDQFLRFFRIGVGISWFVGLVSPLTAAIMLLADGIYSIFRYRQLKITKHFIEDVPRLARMGVALLLIPAVGLV